MSYCPNCRVPTTRQPSGLYKCSICGFIFKPGQSTPLLNKFMPQSGDVMQSQAEVDMEKYMNKIAESLVVIYPDYTEEVKRISRLNRQRIREALQKVIAGQMSFKHFFEWAHTNFGRHPVDLAKLFVDATNGLNSKEAKELRAGCEQFQQYIAGMYNASSSGM